MSGIEILAVIFGIICVVLTVKQHIWCWPTGLVSVVLYVIIFKDAKLYSDMLLQIIYIAMSLYGWWFWVYGNNKSEAIIQKVSKPAMIGLGSVLVIASLAWGYLMSTTDAAFPYLDAVIMVGSLIAQWLLSTKKMQAWYFWILIDVIGIWVYHAKGLTLTSGLYVIFLGLAINGLLTWKKAVNVKACEC